MDHDPTPTPEPTAASGPPAEPVPWTGPEGAAVGDTTPSGASEPSGFAPPLEPGEARARERHFGARAVTTITAGLVLMSAAAGTVGYLVGHQQSPSATVRLPGGFSSPGSGLTGPFGAFPGFGTPTSPSPATIKVPESVRATESAMVDVNTQLNYQGAAGAGTGIVLTSNGLVLTNNHVIDGATSISVTDLGNHRTYSATVVGYDVSRDIAVLRLSGATGLATASFATGTASVGQKVYTVGNAGGAGGRPTVTTGSITALNQSIAASDQGTGTSEELTGMIETDAPLYSGDSGGAMTDSSGRVVGLDTAASATVAVPSGGQGYAIPADTALRVAHDIITGASNAKVHIGDTAFVGVELRSTASGAVVASVIPGSPAASTGLTAGSTITSFDGAPVASASALVARVTGLHPGQSVSITWTGPSGSTHHATLTLGSGPAQ
ncbi:MAG TPA: trypsin-like peptidase domain-containing protein [Acidimicrobiales bacterium]|nr:trypsin-like peptidase domain-containing protein [Acidimicrobiales bacterium]